MGIQVPVLAALLLVLPAAATDGPSVRVRVAEGVRVAELSGEGLRVQDRRVSPRAIQVRARGDALEVAGERIRGPLRVEATEGVGLDGASFPGHLVLLPRGQGRMDVVNVLPLETYVAGVIPSEVYPDWPLEALKAQAVVTRTYALYQRFEHRGDAFDLESSVLSQRYTGRRVPPNVSRAVTATRGERLTYRGRPILAAFHAASGGRTASAHEVWGLAVPYLTDQVSPDDAAPDHFWSFEIDHDDLVRALREAGYAAASPGRLAVVARSRSGRVAALVVGGARLSGHELRGVLGGRAIRSALFDVRSKGGTVRFLGSGSGHGVGLSQWGTRELALRGKTYQQILAHYYPGTQLESSALRALPRPAPVGAQP